jgi:NAD-dependent deacetylase
VAARDWTGRLEDAARVPADADTLFVFTGSGMSVESGIPTFRGADGLWQGARPEDVATPQAFERDPQFVWSWYRERILAHRKARPHPGHKALARLERAYGRFTIATQNVDLLHEAAGSRAVLHLHGRMSHVRCTRCHHRDELKHRLLRNLPPRCPDCGAWLRPDVVWFGEPLPESAFREANAAAAGCDVALVVGTSNLVFPAASLPLTARAAGARLVEVNPEPSALTAEADHHLAGAAASVLPVLARRVAELRRQRARERATGQRLNPAQGKGGP